MVYVWVSNQLMMFIKLITSHANELIKLITTEKNYDLFLMAEYLHMQTKVYGGCIKSLFFSLSCDVMQ